jgi:hypothetical protein
VVVHDRRDLGAAYDRTGGDVVVLQELVTGTPARCIHAGGETAVVGAVPAGSEERIAAEARRLAAACGLELWGFDVVVRHGRPCWVAGPDPWPAIDPQALGEAVFERVVDAVARRLLVRARAG